MNSWLYENKHVNIGEMREEALGSAGSSNRCGGGDVRCDDTCTTLRSRGRSSSRCLVRASLVTADLLSKYPKASTHCHTHTTHVHTGEATTGRLIDNQRTCRPRARGDSGASVQQKLGPGMAGARGRSERRRRGSAVASSVQQRAAAALRAGPTIWESVTW